MLPAITYVDSLVALKTIETHVIWSRPIVDFKKDLLEICDFIKL